MEALADAIGLRALGLGARVIDILDREVELVFVPLGVARLIGQGLPTEGLAAACDLQHLPRQAACW